MLTDIEHLEYLRAKFTELGATVQKLSEENGAYFDDILDDFDEFRDVLNDLVGADYLTKIKQGVQEIHDSKSEIMELLSKSTSNIELSFTALGGIPETMKDEFEKFSEKLRSSTEEKTQVIQKRSEWVPYDPEGVDATKKGQSSVATYMGREFGTVKGKVKGFLGTLKAPSPGNILATGIVWAAFGFKDKDRVAAEAGEIKDLLVYAADAGAKGAVKAATAHLSSMQETLQKLYGVPREAVQRTADAFSRGGVATSDFLKKSEVGIRGVKDTIHAYALAVDMFLNQASGTAAQKMVDYMGDYGKTLKESEETMQKMLDYGAASGIGIQQFSSNVQRAASELKNLGFDIDEVIEMTYTLGEAYADLGVPKQFAGRYAAIGMQQMASGMSNMSDDFAQLVAKEAGYGEGLSGIQRYREGLQRVATGKDKEHDKEFQRLVEITADLAMEYAGGDEALARKLLEEKAGYGFEGARAAMEYRKLKSEGKEGEASGKIKGVKAAIGKSLKTERSKHSKWQREMNRWMKGIALMGQAMLSMVAKALAVLVAYFKALPAMFMNFMKDLFDPTYDSTEDNKRLMGVVMSFGSGLEEDWNKMGKSLNMMAKAAKEGGAAVVGESMQALKSAWSFDPFSSQKRPDFPSMGEAAPTMPYVQTVMVPTDREAVTPYMEDVIGKRRALAAKAGVDWVGGNLAIVSKGADDKGNLELALTGSCPRCGLLYGDTSKAEASAGTGGEMSELGAPVGRQISIVNPNTGQAVTVDPTTASGMKELSRVSRGAKTRRAGLEGTLDPKIGRILSKIGGRFPGKTIKVYSGHREGGKGVHSKGQAIDIGVEGVKKEDLFRYIRSNIKSGGQGFYPNQPFVHVDVRPGKAVWVDFDKKGEKGGDKLGGPAATKWLNEHIGYEKGPVTRERYREKEPPQTSSFEDDFDFDLGQTVLED